MDPVLAALAIQEQIEKIGAYAGFAAIPGLAVLVLLYFAQAREVKRLREWAGRAPERAQELEERVAAQAAEAASAARRVTAQPLARPGTPAAARTAAAATQQPSARPAPAATAARPAGVPPARPAPAPVAAAATSARPGAPAPGLEQAEEDASANGPAREVAGDKVPAPATTAAGAARTAGTAQAASPPSAPSRPAPPRAPAPGARPAPRAPAAAPLRASRPSATLPSGTTRPRRALDDSYDLDLEPERRRLLPRALAIAMGGAGLVAGLVALVVVLGGGGGGREEPATTPTASRGTAPAPVPGAPIDRRTVTVAVLNGTTVPGLAAQVADELEAAGFKRGAVTNAADQQRASTVVSYAPGYLRAAQEVGQLLKVSSIAPADPGTQAIAGPEASVVVTVGTDRTQ